MRERYFTKYYQKTPKERIELLNEWLGTKNNQGLPSLPEELGNQLIENYIGNYDLPLGLGVNIRVNDKEYVVPMAIEEPSVIAAVSKGGKTLGNILAHTTERNLIGQIIVETTLNIEVARERISDNKEALLHQVAELSPSMVERGGGPRDLWVEVKRDDDLEFITFYLSFDPRDAMGANVMNTTLEALAPRVEELLEGKVLMSILSNYHETALTRAQVHVQITRLDADPNRALALAEGIEKACRYANIDPYRATTHNKGIMNGIDPILIATGNDWRAVEAGVHAYASRRGSYQSMTQWYVDKDKQELVGKIELPLQVATVGGTLSTHPSARWALEVMQVTDAKEFANLVAAVGLIQNFSALLALVGDGIQKGHMSMQARSLALRVGATVEEVPSMVEALKREVAMNETVARRILKEIRKEN